MCEGESFPKWAQSPLCFITGKLLCSKARWASGHYHGNQLFCNIWTKGVLAQSVPTCSEHNDDIIRGYVWYFGVDVVIQTLYHKYKVSNLIWNKNMWLVKTQDRVWRMKTRVWKNTKYEDINKGRWFSAQGIYLMSFNIIKISCNLWRKLCWTKPLNHIFH